MANVLGTVEETRPATLGNVESVLAADGASLHWYGKDDVRPLRKMGHLTLTGADGAADDEADVDGLLTRARDLRDGLTFD
jgi:5-(carboxyamino)imidazole ribonucleotide synthase